MTGHVGGQRVKLGLRFGLRPRVLSVFFPRCSRSEPRWRTDQSLDVRKEVSEAAVVLPLMKTGRHKQPTNTQVVKKHLIFLLPSILCPSQSDKVVI